MYCDKILFYPAFSWTHTGLFHLFKEQTHFLMDFKLQKFFWWTIHGGERNSKGDLELMIRAAIYRVA